MSDIIKHIDDALDVLKSTDFNSSEHIPYLETWEAALAVLQKIASGDDWFDISNAPRDGGSYIFFSPANPTAINIKARYEEVIIDYWKITSDGWWNELPEAKYTHWKHIDGAKHIKMMMEKELIK